MRKHGPMLIWLCHKPSSQDLDDRSGNSPEKEESGKKNFKISGYRSNYERAFVSGKNHGKAKIIKEFHDK